MILKTKSKSERIVIGPLCTYQHSGYMLQEWAQINRINGELRSRLTMQAADSGQRLEKLEKQSVTIVDVTSKRQSQPKPASRYENCPKMAVNLNIKLIEESIWGLALCGSLELTSKVQFI